jgi:hypothetical protein
MKINKAKKNFSRFSERLFEIFNAYFEGLVSKEDLREFSYLKDLVMFLVNKDVNFDISLAVFIPTNRGEIDKTVFEFEYFNRKLSVFIPMSELIPSKKSYNDVEMSLIVMICSEVDKSFIKEVSEKYGLEFLESDRYITYGGYYPKYWAKVYYTSERKKIVLENFEPIKIFFALGR